MTASSLGVTLFFPIFPPMSIVLFFLSRLTASSTPSLLKPIRLIMAWSSLRRNNLFLGFPACPFGVSVPISINPNPKLDNCLYKTAFLSKPAARPTGLGNFKPNTSLSKLGCSTLYKLLIIRGTPGIAERNLIIKKEK